MEDWRNEFQYLLDRKMLSRDELAYLFGQIKSIVERNHQCDEISKLKGLLRTKDEAIKGYGVHLDSCAVRCQLDDPTVWNSCDCGLEQALKGK